MLEDLESGFAYVLFYSYIDGSSEHYRISYSIDENGTVALGEVKRVHRTWEVVEDTSKVAEAEISTKPVEEPQEEEVQEKKEEEMAEKEEDKKEPAKGEETPEEENPVTEEKTEEDNKEEEKKAEDCSLDESSITEITEASTEVNVPEVTTETASQEQFESEELTVDNNHQELPSEEKEVSSASTPIESEKEQFAALKLEEKVNLLNSYKDQLNSDKYGEFMTNIMNYENSKDLEVSILKSIVSLKEETSTSRRAFSYAYVNNSEKKDDTGDNWVARALHRTR